MEPETLNRQLQQLQEGLVQAKVEMDRLAKQ